MSVIVGSWLSESGFLSLSDFWRPMRPGAIANNRPANTSDETLRLGVLRERGTFPFPTLRAVIVTPTRIEVC